jgi:hypothetical protein
MTAKIIEIEKDEGPFRASLENVLRMVPDRDRPDVDLRRLLAFRLRTDGEAALKEYLMARIRDSIQCGHSGRLYEFLVSDPRNRECPPTETDRPTDPGAA